MHLLKPAVILSGILLNIPIAHATFSDVYNHSQNNAAINYLAEQGIINGYADGTYRPQQTINRAEFTKIIVESHFEKDEINCGGADIKVLFADTPMNEWYIPHLCVATLRAQVITGYPDGTFHPERNINFAEAAKIITKMFGLYSDWGKPPMDPWYKGYVQVLAEKKSIPLSISSFDQFITRGEMAEMVYRILVPGDYQSHTYNELAGVIDGSKSPVELIDELNITDWTDEALLNALCAAAKRPNVVAITGGEHPPCDPFQAYKWHEWRDRYWPR